MEIKNQRSDYISFYKFYYLNKFIKYSAWALPLLLIIAYNISVNNKSAHFFTLFICLSLVYSIAVYFIPLFYSVFQLNWSVSKGSRPYEKKTISIMAHGLVIITESGKTEWRWENIVSAYRIKNFTVIVGHLKKNILIPNRFFGSQNEAVLFLEEINNNVPTANRSEILSDKVKSVYNWGYLGFIPLVGLFVGVGLLIRGVFQYKDKKLILIGLGDIIFTAVLYASMIAFVGKDSNSKAFCQLELNNVARSIKFYKDSFRVYPDKLEQLEKMDTTIIIKDFYGYKKSSVNFFYKKIEEKYTLFSIGPDGKEYTNDDIYPAIHDSNLIRPNELKK